MHTYGTVYLRYENRCYYWEMVVLARKFFVVFAARALSVCAGERHGRVHVRCRRGHLTAQLRSLGLRFAHSTRAR